MVWVRDARASDVGHDARAYTGKVGDYLFTVVTFEIESQGFPKGSRGYDGAVCKGMMVVRMTRDFAELAASMAEKKGDA